MPKNIARTFTGEYESQLRWPDAKRGPWIVTAEWNVVDGRVAMVALQICPCPGMGPTPITSRTLRGLRIGDLASSRTGFLEAAIDGLQEEPVEDLEAHFARATLNDLAREFSSFNAGLSRRKGGRPVEFGVDHYQQVADCYTRSLLATGKPLQAIASRWQVTTSTAGRWVHTARHKFDLLPPTRPGKTSVYRGVD